VTTSWLSVSCGECGRLFKSRLALTKHAGSRPCQREATRRLMRVRGWAVTTAPDALDVLSQTELDYEEAPAEVVRGGGPGRIGGWDLVKRPWCAVWAVPIIDATLVHRTRRAAIINSINGDEKKIRAWQVAVALDRNAAFVAYSEDGDAQAG
jgi:hypothetical protein